jgi:DNA (cytosine-5)-methyltransferase 1
MKTNPLTPITFIDLFAGLGGFRLGLEANGLKCVYGSDVNKHAAQTYEANFGENILSDITEIKPKSLPDFDILCGGFPCQPFSSAGLKLGFNDTRGTLFFDIVRILKTKKPKVIFLENVKNLTVHDEGNTFKVIIATLEKLGYKVSYKVLNAYDFGVPQNRERIVIVGTLGDTAFDFDKVKFKKRPILASFLDKGKRASDYKWLDPSEYTLIPQSEVKKQISGLIFVGYRNKNIRTVGVNPNTTNLSRVHKQPNRIYSDQGSHPTLSSQETNGRYFILTTKQDGSQGVRKLSITEAYRIFGFPKKYKLVGKLGEQYARIGNSICVPMIEAVGKEIVSQLL